MILIILYDTMYLWYCSLVIFLEILLIPCTHTYTRIILWHSSFLSYTPVYLCSVYLEIFRFFFLIVTEIPRQLPPDRSPCAHVSALSWGMLLKWHMMCDMVISLRRLSLFTLQPECWRKPLHALSKRLQYFISEICIMCACKYMT